VDLPNLGLASAWLEVSVKPDGEHAFWPLGERSEVFLKAAACPASWELGGNAGTLTGTNFLGTTDNQALELRTANTRSLRLTPSALSPEGFPATTNIVVGSQANRVSSAVFGGAVSGGGASANSIADLADEGPNRVFDHFGVIGGGYANTAGTDDATLDDARHATIGGGQQNSVTAPWGTIGGGLGNSVGSGTAATIGGGVQNEVSNTAAFVGAGSSNRAAGSQSVVVGGGSNDATGAFAAIAGGVSNAATGEASSVSGGLDNCAGGNYSWAGGRSAKVLPAANPADGSACAGLAGYTGQAHSGSFVWADNQSLDFASTGSDQFLVRSQGGVAINASPISDAVELSITADPDDSDFANIFLRQRSNNAGILFTAGGASASGDNNASFFIDHFNGAGGQGRRVELLGTGVTIIRSNITGAASGVTMAAGAGSWSSLSDRSVKTAIAAIDPLDVLERLVALPISEWSYIAQGKGIRHLGPMAQDFAAAFRLGENDTTISTIDADGVALTAIQGLNAKLESENTQLRSQLQALLQRVAALEARTPEAQ
jgi:hypothetical protein